VLEPTKNITFLGFTLDSVYMKISLPQRKLDRLSQNCRELLQVGSCSIRQTAQVIGAIISCLPAFNQGRLHYRQLEACKIRSLKEWKGNFDKKHIISDEARIDLLWWSCNLTSKVGVPISLLTYHDVEAFSDASLSGYGFCFEEQYLAGVWVAEDLQRAKNSINGLELLAIEKGLKAYIGA